MYMGSVKNANCMCTLKRKYEGSTFFNSRNLIFCSIQYHWKFTQDILPCKVSTCFKGGNMLDPTKLRFKCIYSWGLPCFSPCDICFLEEGRCPYLFLPVLPSVCASFRDLSLTSYSYICVRLSPYWFLKWQVLPRFFGRALSKLTTYIKLNSNMDLSIHILIERALLT